MKLIKITIILEPENAETDKQHATVLEWSNNLWTANGAVYSRLMGVLASIVNLIRGRSDS